MYWKCLLDLLQLELRKKSDDHSEFTYLEGGIISKYNIFFCLVNSVFENANQDLYYIYHKLQKSIIIKSSILLTMTKFHDDWITCSKFIFASEPTTSPDY